MTYSKQYHKHTIKFHPDCVTDSEKYEVVTKEGANKFFATENAARAFIDDKQEEKLTYPKPLKALQRPSWDDKVKEISVLGIEITRRGTCFVYKTKGQRDTDTTSHNEFVEDTPANRKRITKYAALSKQIEAMEEQRDKVEEALTTFTAHDPRLPF